MVRTSWSIIALLPVVASCRPAPPPPVDPPPEPVAAGMPWVRVAADKSGFVLEPSGRAFRVWGVNYDHDPPGRLIEDYWIEEWPRVEQDFAQIRKLGANVVRVHLQFGK